MLLSVLLAGPASAAGWWNIKWPYRIKVKLNPKDLRRLKEHKLPGDDVAAVEFRTSSLAGKTGNDIRIVTASGSEMAYRVLQIGPGDLISLAFAIRPGTAKYYIYFGNPVAGDIPPTKSLDIKRGVLLEVWHYNGGLGNNISQARQALARGQKKPIIGRGFRSRVFAGHNPFGPQNKIVARYTAYSIAPKSGEYFFACSSNNASFLLVNDRLLISNGGWHRPQRNIRQSGRISLVRGLNKLTFIHVNPRGWPVAVLACRTPGKRKISPIPPAACSEVLRAKAGAIERYGSPANIDFIVSPGGEAFMQNRYYQRRIFDATSVGRGLDKTSWEWNFGDGQTLTGPGKNIQHVYLEPGAYEITLQNKAKSGLKRTHHVRIDRDWDKVTRSKLDSLKDYAKIVADYNFSTLNSKANVEAALLLRRAGDFRSLHKACEAFVKRATAGDAEIRTLLPIYVEALLPTGQANRAVAALKQAATMTRNPNLQAETLVQAAQLQLDPLNQPEAAMKTFEDVLARLSKSVNAPIVRSARIGIGDVWLARGDADKARAAYIKAGVMDKRAKSFRAIAKGDFARRAEDYLRRKKYVAAREILDEWERTLPGDKLEGFSTLLRCKLLLARTKYALAARCAETLVKANPGSNYAAELLMHAAEAYSQLKQIDKANRCLARIVKNYHESSLFHKAVEKLR